MKVEDTEYDDTELASASWLATDAVSDSSPLPLLLRPPAALPFGVGPFSSMYPIVCVAEEVARLLLEVLAML